MNRVRLLIVEDDRRTYTNMMSALDHEFNRWDVNPIIEHATYLTEAKRKLKELKPQVVSTDMTLPHLSDSPLEAGAGAHFVAYLRRNSDIPCLIYSSFEVRRSEEQLCAAGVISFPPILVKNPVYGHQEWAEHLTKLLLKYA